MPYKRSLRKRPRKGRKTYATAKYRRRRRAPMYKYPFRTGGEYLSLVYKENASLSTSASAPYDLLQQWALNDMFDFDYSNATGNKQPLYFNQVLGANGPYYRFSVIGWKTIIEITNAGSSNLEIGYGESLDTTSIDTVAELEDWPGAVTRQITPATGGKPFTRIVKTNTLVNAIGRKTTDLTWSGLYNSSPASNVYGNLVVHEVNNTACAFKLKIMHIFKVRVWGTRAQAS